MKWNEIIINILIFEEGGGGSLKSYVNMFRSSRYVVAGTLKNRFENVKNRKINFLNYHKMLYLQLVVYMYSLVADDVQLPDKTLYSGRKGEIADHT